MNGPSISVAGLSKRYTIGALRRNRRNFREALGDALLAPVRRLRSFGRSSHREADTIWALRDVSFEARPGEVLGVIGENGAGKTTLLKVLSRITSPTEGRAVLNGRVASLLEVGTGFHPELTGRENVYLSGAILGLSRAEIAARFDRIVDFSGVEQFIDTPVKRYSSGMRVRLGFAVAAHLEPDILLIDEVLAVGDAAFRRKCLGKMGNLQGEGRTVLFVSHNLSSVRYLCTSCLALQDGAILAAGDVHATIDAYLKSVQGGEATGTGGAYVIAAPHPAPDAYVTRIELLGADGEPAAGIATADDLRVRIHFRCVRAGRYSIAMHIGTLDGVTVAAFGTERTAGFHLRCAAGDHFVDLDIPSLPLTAGNYTVGAAIGVPRRAWLHRVENAGEMEVGPADVFGTGRPPAAEHCLVALEHTWRPPEDDDGLQRID